MIEKMLDRLEELKFGYFLTIANTGCETMNHSMDHIMDHIYQEVAGAIDKCSEIIKDVAQEYNDGWIPCNERLPEEHDSIFAKAKGTDKWNDAMFEKTSDEVNVTVVDQNGKGVTTRAHTIDGRWVCDLLRVNKSYRITAWQPLPEPYQPKGE